MGADRDGQQFDRMPQARTLRGNPHRLLVTLLVGNNLVNIAINSIVPLLVARFLPPGFTVVLATLSVSVRILVFGEIVPKARRVHFLHRTNRAVHYAIRRN